MAFEMPVNESCMFEDFRLKMAMRSPRKKKAAEKESKEKMRDFDPSKQDPEGYEVYKKITGGAGWFIFYPVVLVSLLVIVPAVAVLKAEWLVWLVIAIIALLVLQGMLNNIRYHFFFKGWRKKLPFVLTGWDELIKSKKMYCDLCWTDVTVTVIPKEHALQNRNTAEETKWIEAAMALLARRVQKAFYQAEVGTSDKRKKWESRRLSASGSANPDVLKALKTTCQKELAYIGKKHQTISEVQISLDSEEYEVPIEITSSEGTAS